MSAPTPPPVAPPPTNSNKTNRVLGICIIVLGSLYALFGLLQVMAAETNYEAGGHMGKVTMGLLAAGAGVYIVMKNKPRRP